MKNPSTFETHVPCFLFSSRLRAVGWAGGSTDGHPTSSAVFRLTQAPPIPQNQRMQVVRRVTGRPDRDMIPVDSGYGTPPALEGRSCLYVLRYSSLLKGGDRRTGGRRHPSVEAPLPPPAGHGDGYATARANNSPRSSLSAPEGEEAGVWFYVGESDAIRERLQRHASRWGGGDGGSDGALSGGGGGGRDFKLDAVVVAVDNRSEARRLETAVIRAMKEEGFHLVSDKDGSRTHFSSPK